MKKKLSFLFALSMLLTLAGCDTTTTMPESSVADRSATEKVETDTPTETEEMVLDTTEEETIELESETVFDSKIETAEETTESEVSEAETALEVKEETVISGMVNVEIETTYEIINDEVFITIHTNLPDETKLMLTLSGDAFANGMAQSNATVQSGVAVSSGFSNQGSLLSGHFQLDVTMVMPKLQADSVTSIIGTDGEFLAGEYVTDSLSGGKTIEATFELDF